MFFFYFFIYILYSFINSFNTYIYLHIHSFHINICNYFQRIQCPIPFRVTSSDLRPSRISVQRLWSLCWSCAVVRCTLFLRGCPRGIQKNGSTNIILILSKIVNGTPYAGMWTSNKWTEGVVPCLTYIVGSGFITNCDLMNVPQFRWEHWWDPAHLHWRNDTIRTCWALDSAIRSWDVGWIKVIDERFKTIRCVFLEIVHSFWNIRYRQECQAVEHPAEELHVVIRAIQRHKSKLLHFAPRTLGEMIKATSALNVRSEGIADSVDGSLFKVSDDRRWVRLKPQITTPVQYSCQELFVCGLCLAG